MLKQALFSAIVALFPATFCIAQTGFHTVVTNQTLVFNGAALPGPTESIVFTRSTTETSSRPNAGRDTPWGPWIPGTWTAWTHSPAPGVLSTKFSQVLTKTAPHIPEAPSSSLDAEFFAADKATGGWALSKTNPPVKLNPAQHLGAVWVITATRGVTSSSSGSIVELDNKNRTRTTTETFTVVYSYAMKPGTLVN